MQLLLLTRFNFCSWPDPNIIQHKRLVPHSFCSAHLWWLSSFFFVIFKSYIFTEQECSIHVCVFMCVWDDAIAFCLPWQEFFHYNDAPHNKQTNSAVEAYKMRQHIQALFKKLFTNTHTHRISHQNKVSTVWIPYTVQKSSVSGRAVKYPLGTGSTIQDQVTPRQVTPGRIL